MNGSAKAPKTAPRVILLDDDPIFGKLMRKTAEQNEIQLDFFPSLSQLHFISQLADYDVVIVDLQMDHINGIEIAAYLPRFVGKKPVILISNTDISQQIDLTIHGFITEFIHKNLGLERILTRSMEIFRETQAPIALSS